MNKCMVFLVLASFCVSLLGMERYRTRRDEILRRNYPNDELGQASEQYKNSLLNDYHKALDNAVTKMGRDEGNEPLTIGDLLLGGLVSCTAWNLYSQSPDCGLVEYCLCGGSVVVGSLTVLYGVVDVCHCCHKIKCAQQLKAVQDLVRDRDALLHKD